MRTSEPAIGTPPAIGAADYFHAHWYAIYTCAQHEKRVAKHMQDRGIENFLPLYETTRRWKDRKMKLQLPVFPGYVFTKIALQNRLQVLQVPGVVRLVGFDGQPSRLPDVEVEALRTSCGALKMQPYPYLTIGKRVRITAGSLHGCEGILIRKKDSYRVVLSVDAIMSSVAVEIDGADVEAI